MCYDTRTRTWKDGEFGNGASVEICAKFPRIRYHQHGVHEVDIEWAGCVSRLTRRLELRCVEYACATPVSLAAELLNVDDNTIWRIVKSESDAAMREMDPSELTEICIDETQSRKGHDYITLVTRPDTGRVIFGTHGKDVTTMMELVNWLIHHGCDPKNIRKISCDMSKSFLKGCMYYFPNAEPVLDHFHIKSMATDMVDTVRRGLGVKGRAAKAVRFKLLKNRDSLSEDELRKVESIIDEYADLGVAYEIKEALTQFYSERNPDHANVYLRWIINDSLNSRIKAVMDFGKTLERHFDGIIAWHTSLINNGVSEGNNSVIQSMKSAARGFANVENMISLLLLRSARREEKRKGIGSCTGY